MASVRRGRRRRSMPRRTSRSEEHTSELQSQSNLVCRLLLEKKKEIELPGHFDFVMGVRGVIHASEHTLTFLVMNLPHVCTLNVAVIDRHQLRMSELRLRMGA